VKSTGSLRHTFQHGVRPDDYLGRAWLTTIVAAIGFAAYTAYRGGQFDLSVVMPAGGWHPRDPYGTLYVETWATILVDGLQAGFGLWGAVLIFLGVYKLVSVPKFLFTYFSLGGAFVAFAFFLPSWTVPLLKLACQHYPFLTQ